MRAQPFGSVIERGAANHAKVRFGDAVGAVFLLADAAHQALGATGWRIMTADDAAAFARALDALLAWPEGLRVRARHKADPLGI